MSYLAPLPSVRGLSHIYFFHHLLKPCCQGRDIGFVGGGNNHHRNRPTPIIFCVVHIKKFMEFHLIFCTWVRLRFLDVETSFQKPSASFPAVCRILWCNVRGLAAGNLSDLTVASSQYNTNCSLRLSLRIASHQGNLNNLCSIDIGGSVFSILTHFLSNRSQQVMVDGCLSKLVNIVSGVPQGSVFGVLLFLLYTSELFAF